MIKKLPLNELAIGMTALEAVITSSGQELAPVGTKLSNELLSKMQLYNIDSLIVDAGDTLLNREAVKIVKQSVEPKTNSQPLTESTKFKEFQLHYFQTVDYLKTVFYYATTTKGYLINEQQLVQSISPLYLSSNSITELFDMLHHMHYLTDSIYAHSINVALICRTFGNLIHLAQSELDVLTCCGLLHDIGKVAIPDTILNKPAKLTPQEFSYIQFHTKAGYDILSNQRLDRRIPQTALTHHERCDGSGYPMGLSYQQLDEFSTIVTIADVYDAMTAARSYRSPLCAFEAIEIFEQDNYKKYHTKYLYVFLNHIASTYQNSHVLLNDGRRAKIVMLNQNCLSKPLVQLDNGKYLNLFTSKDIYISKIL